MTTATLPEAVENWITYLREDCEEGLGPTIRNVMDEDDEPDYKLTRRLIRDYLNSTPSQRAIIDRTLTTITGWTLDSLLEQSAMPRKALQDFRNQVIDSGGSDF